jgi:hypothetical protein
MVSEEDPDSYSPLPSDVEECIGLTSREALHHPATIDYGIFSAGTQLV